MADGGVAGRCCRKDCDSRGRVEGGKGGEQIREKGSGERSGVEWIVVKKIDGVVRMETVAADASRGDEQ